MFKTDTLLYSKYPKRKGISGILMTMAYLFFLMALPLLGMGQDEAEYDEVTVFLNIQKVGGAEISAVIREETVYLPIVDIFTFLKVKNTSSAQMDSVSGFFINQQATYIIDKINNRITYQGKVFDLKKDDMVKTETSLYLRSPLFGEIFGLDCEFSFRSLSVLLTTKLELPIIREMRQEQMRANINRLTGEEMKTDTTIGRKYPLLHFGMADWSVISTQQLGGKTDARINLDLGTVIAGGEANVRLNYSNNTPFSEKQQQYLWRFVNNDSRYVKQVMAGKINTPVTASIYDPIVGVQVTNTPTTYRRSFGTYTLSNITEPNWLVELYVNNVLVDYMKADGSGFYKFEVPLVYGNSAIKLKFYGLWGEERIQEENISIPFNFLPPKELEYTMSAGVVEDSLRSRFSRGNFNYGVSRRLTVGGGVEYLSSVRTGNAMPFFSSSLRLLDGLLLTGEYTYGVRAKGLVSYRLPSNLQFEVNYTKYNQGQKAIIYNYLEERKATVSIPIKGKNFAAYSRFTINQIVLPTLKNTNAEMLWSGSVYGVSTNFTTYGLFTDLSKPYLYSNLSLAFRLPARISFTPQAQYEYNSKQLISFKANLEKPLFKNGFFNMSFEQNFRSQTRSVELGFRYDLAFAQTGLSVRNTDNQTTLVESARGSLLHDLKTRYLGTNNRSSVGKGAITLLPFLDVNGNGHHDKGEPKADGLKFKINGGTIVRNDKDTTIRILDLTPYSSYLLELDKNSFDNISWQIQTLSMKVMIDPNQFKTIEVPISIMGEASGTVYSGSNGQGRILVCFYRNDSILVGRTLTESDGYYSYLGLKPGKYTVRIDRDQLKRIKMVAAPDKMPVTFSNSIDGDMIDGIDFLLSPDPETMPDTTLSTSQVEPLPDPEAMPDTTLSTSQVEQLPDPEAMPGTTLSTSQVEPLPDSEAMPDTTLNTSQVEAIPDPETMTDTTLSTSQVEPLPDSTIQKAEVSKLPISSTTNNLMDDSIQKTVPERNPAKLTYKMQIISYKDKSLHVGAFRIKSNAFGMVQKLKKITDKPAVVMYGKDYYFVKISGLATRATLLELAALLNKSGVESFYIPGNKTYVYIQAGEYGKEEEAVIGRMTLLQRTSQPVSIMYEKSLYKLIITGFASREAALDFVSEMEK